MEFRKAVGIVKSHVFLVQDHDMLDVGKIPKPNQNLGKKKVQHPATGMGDNRPSALPG